MLLPSQGPWSQLQAGQLSQCVSLRVPSVKPPPTTWREAPRLPTPVPLLLTLMPSNRDRARRGRSARSVRSDLMGPISAKPRVLATRLMSETCGRQGEGHGDSSRDRWKGPGPPETARWGRAAGLPTVPGSIISTGTGQVSWDPGGSGRAQGCSASQTFLGSLKSHLLVWRSRDTKPGLLVPMCFKSNS